MFNIDDIYLAAVNGETEKLASILKAGEVDINEPLDCGVNSGVRTVVPPLYSILHAMSQNGYHYDALDLLVGYGVDLDAHVVLTSDAFTRKIPLIAYAIRDFKSVELVRYLLDRGADPNLRQFEEYADGHAETYPLLELAIMFWDNCDMMELLLSRGADPNARALTYSQQYACRQLQPMISYALLSCGSREKSAMLFRYGADAGVQIDVGGGMFPKSKFVNYVQMLYPKYSDLLLAAQREGFRSPRQPVPVSREQFLFNRPAVTPAPSAPETQPAAAPVSEEPDALQELRQMAGTLIQFDTKWAYSHACAVRDSQEKPTLFNRGKIKKAAENAAKIEEDRKFLIGQLNRLDRELTGGKTPRWWNAFNGLDYAGRDIDAVVLWVPFTRFEEVHEGLRLSAACTATDTLNGNLIECLVHGGEASRVYGGELDPQREYRIAELCLWRIKDATQVRRTEMRVYEDHEIPGQMKAYAERLDEMERMFNLLGRHDLSTDEEMHLMGRMSTSDFFKSQMNREYLTNSYARKLQEETYTRVEVENREIYCQEFRPMGIVVLEGERVVQVLVYRQARPYEEYYTDQSKVIYNLDTHEVNGSHEADRLWALCHIGCFPLEKADLLGIKPEYLSDREWYEFVYNCYRIPKDDTVENRIRRFYQQASKQKRYVVRSSLGI